VIVEFDDTSAVLRCRGDEDRATQGHRRRALARAIKANRDVTVELRELVFADSSLMVDLAVLARRQRVNGRKLRLRNPQPQVRAVILGVGLHRLPGVRLDGHSTRRWRCRPIRTLAFAGLDGEPWGAAWFPSQDASAPLACANGSATNVVLAELHGSDATEPWRLEGDAVSLLLTPAAPAVHGGGEDVGVESLDQLCSVSGSLTLDGSEHQISCLGWRSTADSTIDLSAIDSFRQTSGWFEAPAGLALLSLRPRKARGHDADLIAAAVLEPEDTAPMAVADPRLSTTYDADGLPTRVGLELWLELEGSDAYEDDGAEQQISRRAAAEAIGAAVEWEVRDFQLHAVQLRWHSRGSDGAGVYLLAQHA
jgi:anti-anti-sigma regulatory factor